MRSVFVFAILSGTLVAAMQSPYGLAQSAIVPTPAPLISMIQASDGNLYGLYPGQANASSPNGACIKGLNDACGGIYVVRKDGSSEEIHQLEVGGYPNAEGNLPISIIEGPDGFLYGTTVFGGTGGSSGCEGAGCGVFFRIGLDGATGPDAEFTVLHNFSYAESTQGGPIILGTDDYFYGAGGQNDFGPNTIWKITPDGDVTVLYNFSYSATPPNPYANGAFPSGLVEGTDGNFYGTTLASSDSGYDGTVFQLTPTGSLKTIAGLPGDGTFGVNPSGALVEGIDGEFYGTTRGASYNSLTNPLATVFKVSADGDFTTLYTFSAVEDGIYPVTSPMVVDADGNLYGTARDGGDPTHCVYLDGCGVMFGITPDGDFTPLLTFEGGEGAAYPNSLFINESGLIAGTAASDGTPGTPQGVVFFEEGLAGAKTQVAIGLRFRDPATGNLTTEVKPGTDLDLEWAVANAFSNTMQYCAAFRDDAKDPDWTGPQFGALSAEKLYEGIAQITAPMQPGTYTYALTCGGVESGFAELTVGNNLILDSTSLPNATVSIAYTDTLTASGGTPPYTWNIIGGNIGADIFSQLELAPATGVLTLTPVQFGSQEIDIEVEDSSDPLMMVTKTLTLVAASGLMLPASLPAPLIGTPYSQSLNATGGIAPYKFTLASGTLPTGLTFNTTTGLVSGTATQLATSTFAIMLSDSENPAATLTQTYTFTTKAPPLAITSTSPLPGLTVNAVYSYTLAATGGIPPYTWSVSPVIGGPLPAGVTLSAAGVLSGTALQFSNGQSLGVRVTDSSTPPLMQDAQFSYTILSGLAASTPAFPAAIVGASYTSPAPKATGGLPPYIWNDKGNPPPQGSRLSIDPSTGILSGVPTIAGTYTFTLTVLDSEGNAATASVLAPLTVLPPAVASVTTVTSSNAAAGTGMPVTFTATVTSTGGRPTGTVIFYNGTTSLGTANVDAAGTATLTTMFAATGVYNITAAYSGDSATLPSTSSAVVETVVTPSVTATLSPADLTIQPGSSGTILLTFTPVGGYTGTVSFSCGALPAHVSCTFAPSSLTIPAGGAAETTTLTIDTGAATSAANHVPRMGNNASGGLTMALGLWLPGPLLLIGAWSRRRRSRRFKDILGTLVLAALGVVAIGSINGCGGASDKAAPGTYTIAIKVTAGAAVQSVNTTLVVQ